MGASQRKGTSHIFSSQPLLLAALGPDAWKPGRTQAEKHPQDDLGAYLGRELPGLLVTSRLICTPSPPPRACSSASSQGRRHKREPRLLEPSLPWGRGPQDPHLVAIEEEKL